MKEWIEPQDIKVPQELQAAVGGHPLVARTLARRGLTDVESARAFLDPDRYQPAPPSDLPNMIRAAERLERAIHQGETICVWGDFDVDGQTSTTLLLSTLRDLGAAVRYHIPNRRAESHGVNLPVRNEVLPPRVRPGHVVLPLHLLATFPADIRHGDNLSSRMPVHTRAVVIRYPARPDQSHAYRHFSSFFPTISRPRPVMNPFMNSPG